ncbi:hypothetical protein [Halomonas sp. M20]|uniref:hypothetical protein n=1 Tax=Halomonas sp. M20 TaxID=2763264 RepID=UPI001D0B7C7B|nr:hypothetical protein [Halomonas sp. M20]
MADTFEHWVPETAESTSEYPGITYAELLREISPVYRGMEDDQVDEALSEALDEMTPEEIEGFFSSLGRVAKGLGRTLVRAAPKILPVVGGAVGTVVGGPMGTAVGSQLGGIAGGLVGRATQGGSRRRPRRRTSTPARTARVSRRIRRRGPGRRPRRRSASDNAAAQLLSLIQNPSFLRSLTARLLGDSQASTVHVGEAAVAAPFGAFMNALEMLATEAATEAHSGGTGIPEYLLDETGEAVVDVGDDQARAEHLLALLAEERWASDPEAQADPSFSQAESIVAWLGRAV